jgi:deoxycytidylate deaminase
MASATLGKSMGEMADMINEQWDDEWDDEWDDMANDDSIFDCPVREPKVIAYKHCNKNNLKCNDLYEKVKTKGIERIINVISDEDVVDLYAYFIRDDQYEYDNPDVGVSLGYDKEIRLLKKEILRRIAAQRDRRETTESLDRIDNTKGYVNDNVRWTYKDVNRIRRKLSDADFLEWCRRCLSFSQPKQRPSFDKYFMSLAFVISSRSEDPDTKHGSVIVTNNSNLIIGSGYNALPRKLNPNNYDLTRPGKYSIMIHSEENALLNLSRPIKDYTDGARIYVTGKCSSKIMASRNNRDYYG